MSETIEYKCDVCGQEGVKLWRLYNTFLNQQKLECLDCMEKRVGHKFADKEFPETDQFGGLVPAIPTPDRTTFWGYTSVPEEGVVWWYQLPPKLDSRWQRYWDRPEVDRLRDRIKDLDETIDLWMSRCYEERAKIKTKDLEIKLLNDIIGEVPDIMRGAVNETFKDIFGELEKGDKEVWAKLVNLVKKFTEETGVAVWVAKQKERENQ